MPVKRANSVPAEVVTAGSGTKRQILIGPDEGPHFAMRRFIMEPGGGMPKHTNGVHSSRRSPLVRSRWR
jgi:quercetin dioxygenase-like cupin family protein